MSSGPAERNLSKLEKPKAPIPATKSPEPKLVTTDTRTRLGEVYRLSAGQPQTEQTKPVPAPPPSQASQRSFREEQFRRRCEVAAGVLTTVKLPAAKGEYVYGHLREIDGYEFTWAIVDVKNLGLMERKLRFLAQRGERDVPTATIEWTVPSDGPWFLAFDATGKQYVREVAVELWRRIPE